MIEGNTILITGAASHLAKALAPQLRERFNLVGVDICALTSKELFPGEFYQLRYTKRPFVDIFRRHAIDAIVHLGRIKPTTNIGPMYRYQQNVLGTKSILNIGWNAGVRKFIVVSSHQVYGAFRENYLYLNEDESLRALSTVPELADAVQMDHEATEFMWKHRKAAISVLRPVHIVGPDMDGPLMKALRGPFSPVLLGFDPLMQFIHQDDFIRVICTLLDRPNAKGLFNIAGEGSIPYSDALHLAGTRAIPTISSLFPLLFKMSGYHMPRHFIDHLKFPVVVSDQRFRTAYGFEPQLDIRKTLATI